MNKNYLKGVLVVTLIGGPLIVLFYLANSYPEYFTSQTYLGGFLFLEVMAGAVWLFRRAFFPVVIVTFLFAGMDLPFGSGWTLARWIVLGIGALVGSVIMLKDRRYSFGMFHVLAFFAVLAALVSAAVSRFTTLSSSKVLSLFLLFLYAATGARLAVSGRENHFFAGLLTGCEFFVFIVAAFYAFGSDVMGNPNSLGAVMGVVAVPILLWGILLRREGIAHWRSVALYAVSMYLTFLSHARAGMLAALVSSGLLCLVLRRYRMLVVGVGIVTILATVGAIFRPEEFSRAVSSVSFTVVYKGKDASEGLLASRNSPWQSAIDSITAHFWFGTGFGTSDTGYDATENLAKYSTSSAASTEHGSSYLAIAEWVGIMGVLPFLLLLVFLSAEVMQTLVWTYRTGNPSCAIVPLAIVMLAGMIHAGFEDWLFAPGYYLCVFYWSIAFVFIDQVSWSKTLASRGPFLSGTRAIRHDLGAVASSR